MEFANDEIGTLKCSQNDSVPKAKVLPRNATVWTPQRWHVFRLVIRIGKQLTPRTQFYCHFNARLFWTQIICQSSSEADGRELAMKANEINMQMKWDEMEREGNRQRICMPLPINTIR